MALKKESLKPNKLKDVSSPGQVASTLEGKVDKIGDAVIEGTIVADKDNATSLRMRGAQHTSEGGAKVQSYMGIFNNNAYDTVGTLKTRASWGANLEMDMALQSPHAMLIIAQDGSQTDGVIKLLSQNAVEFHTQYSAEELSPKRLLVDRVSTASKGSSNTSEVVVKANAGSLHLNKGITDGAVVFPVLTTGERDALTPEAGMVIFNSSTSNLECYDGTSWVDLT